MLARPNAALYAECSNIKRTSPDTNIDEETIKQFGAKSRVLPLFEKSSFDYIYTKHYSLETNELLKCRWSRYKQTIDRRVFGPFQFPCQRDLHFHNGGIQFLPSLSIFRQTNFRMKLKPGPGVDLGGQIPIPQELHMKLGEPAKKAKGKNHKPKKNKEHK